MSPHGGKRKGAGRKTVAEKTANLCGVRVTPHQLAAYKATAGLRNMPYAAWVRARLDSGIAPEVITAIALNGPTLKQKTDSVAWRGSETTERYDKPKKSKGKK